MPATRELLAAELADRARLGVLLDAHVPINWPNDIYDEGVVGFFLDRLLDDSTSLGWWSWYGILCDDDRTLVAGLGFKGVPRENAVEVGYGVVEEFRRRGIATEAVSALIDWAFEDNRIARVDAQVHVGNLASERVLSNVGFRPSHQAQNPDGLQRFSPARAQDRAAIPRRSRYQ